MQEPSYPDLFDWEKENREHYNYLINGLYFEPVDQEPADIEIVHDEDKQQQTNEEHDHNQTDKGTL